MNRCPVEILGHIFADACTDDGSTGRSLSLVSKHVREVSRPFALRSVALYGPYQLTEFASLLERTPSKNRRVHHLYLTDRRRLWTEYLPGEKKEEWLKYRINQDLLTHDPHCKHSDAILRILQLLAPTLQTLTILLFALYDEQPIAVHFPVLEELTIHGTSFLGPRARIPECLSLRRLHLIQDFSLQSSVAKAVSSTAPLLSHLRLSRLIASPRGSGDIVGGLERMLQQDDSATTGFPPTLQRILLQTLQQRLYDPAGKLQLFTSPIAYQLKDLAMRDAKRRIFILHPILWDATESFTGDNTDIEYYTNLRTAWEQRIVGSDRVWDMDQLNVVASYGFSTMGD